MSFQYICSTNISLTERNLNVEENKFFLNYREKNFLSNCSCSIIGKIIDKVNMIGYVNYVIIEKYDSKEFSVIKNFPKKIFVKINILPKKMKLKSKNNYLSNIEFLNETCEYNCVTKVLEDYEFSNDIIEDNDEDDGSFTPYDKETVDKLLKIIVDNREFLSY